MCVITADPSTRILGAPNMYVSVGSTINITCVINDAANFPETVSCHIVKHLVIENANKGRNSINVQLSHTSSLRMLRKNI